MESIYERMFGIKPCIIASYPFGSKQGGARLHPEIVEAMAEASSYNVDMMELLKKAGEKIADMLGVEAAFITSGACAGLTLASAAVMTRNNVRLMEQLPDTEHPLEMKNKLIMQLGHITHYTACFRASGAKLVTVGGDYLPHGKMGGETWQEFNESWWSGEEEGWLFHPLVYDEAKKKYIRIFKVLPGHIENAIDEKTAAIVYVRSAMCVRGEYEVSLPDVAKIAKKHNLPVIVDYAAEAYKVSHFRRALDEGADLVIFSGGKEVMGPNDTGMVLGRKDLVEAVSLNSSPHYRMILGRGYKVSREQIVGLVVALQRRLKMDEDAIFQRDIDLCNYIVNEFENFPHVEASVYIPDDEIEGILGHEFPFVRIKLDEEALGIKANEIAAPLYQQEPRIFMTKYLANWGYVEIVPHGLRDGEADIVIDRVKKALLSKRK